MARRKGPFYNRSVIEQMTLGFTWLVVFVIVLTTLLVVVSEFIDPTIDTSGSVDFLTRIITSLLAALLGLLAGQSGAVSDLGKRPDGTEDDIEGP